MTQSIRRGAAGVLAVAFAAGPVSACNFYVNSNGDNVLPDGALTFREALAIADGDHFNGNPIATCLTLAELNQVPGASYLPVPPPACDPTQVRYRILLPPDPGANCGSGLGDNIYFDTNLGPIVAGTGYLLGEHDTIDGKMPNGLSAQIVGLGAGSGDGIVFGVGDTLDKWNVQVSHLEISNFSGDGIAADGCQNAALTGLLIHDNGGHGIFVDGNRCKLTTIGDVTDDQRNYIYSNGLDGIHIEGINNGDPTQQLTLHNNWIGLDGISDLDSSGNGGVGIAVINTLGVTIGGGASGQANAIAKNAGYGIWLTGQRTSSVNVFGNLIGSAPDFDIGGFPNNRGVQIDGAANNNVIGGSGTGEGNAISGNANHGVYVSGAGTDANTVAWNTIGLNPERTVAVANKQDGLSINTGATNTSVHDNVISGNSRWGMYVASSGTTGTTIQNNTIGLRGGVNNANDNTAAANGLGGIWVDLLPGATIGPGNRIAGNNGPGVQVTGESADGVVIKGNRIGLDNASAARGNGSDGVSISGGADNATIGGANASDGNVIGSNSGAGVHVNGNTISGTTIRHNTIGSDATGNVARGNAGEGIHLEQGVAGTSITQNLVVANGNDGIKLETSTNTSYVAANQIGVSASGTIALPNGASGISLLSGAHNNSIGDPVTPLLFNIVVATTNPNSSGIFVANAGTSANAIVGNLIGSTGLANTYGVYVTNGATNNSIDSNSITQSVHAGVAVVGITTTGNAITGNQIFGNGGLGIDLGNDGVTANDLKDADSGPNNLQNYPVLGNVVIGANQVTLTAQLNSTPNQSFEVTLYRSDRCDAGGFGEGQVVLGKTTIGADANGDAGVSGLLLRTEQPDAAQLGHGDRALGRDRRHLRVLALRRHIRRDLRRRLQHRAGAGCGGWRGRQ